MCKISGFRISNRLSVSASAALQLDHKKQKKNIFRNNNKKKKVEIKQKYGRVRALNLI